MHHLDERAAGHGGAQGRSTRADAALALAAAAEPFAAAADVGAFWAVGVPEAECQLGDLLRLLLPEEW